MRGRPVGIARRFVEHEETRGAGRGKERRAQRRHGRYRRRWPIPFLFPILLGLAVARVAVSLAMFVVVPLVLGILSLVLGPRLRDAAARSKGAGERAYEALDRAAQREQVEPDDARIRIEPAEEGRVRFSDARADEESWEDEDEDEDEAREDEDEVKTRRGKTKRAARGARSPERTSSERR